MAYELKTTIHSNQFMVIAYNMDNRDAVVKPGIYSTYAEALHQAQYYAGMISGIKYLVVAVAAVAQKVDNPVVVTGYRL